MGDLDSVFGLGSSAGEGKDYPLEYSCLEVSKSQTCLSDFHFHVLFNNDNPNTLRGSSFFSMCMLIEKRELILFP